MSKFSQDACDAALSKVDMSQAGIQAASAKLLFWKRSAVEVVRCWERAFQRADMDKRLSLIYLVNDVVQTSRRSGREYTEAFHKALPEAFRHMMKHTDEKVQQKLKKLVLVWRDRNVWGNKALGLYLEMVRGVSINASPEVRPKPQAGPQGMPDSIATAAGLFRELQQAQAAVQNATSAEASKATSVKDLPAAQGGMTLAQQQKIEEQVAALEKLIGCRQKQRQLQENLSKELQQLAEASASQLQNCTHLLQKDSDRLKELQGRLSVQGGPGAAEDVDASLGARSLAAAGIPPSAPDLMSGAPAVATSPEGQPAAAAHSSDAPYTPSAHVLLSDTAAAAAPARGGRRDPRARAGGTAPSAPAEPATTQPGHTSLETSVPQVEVAAVDDLELANHLANMEPAESAALLESIMKEAPAVRCPLSTRTL